MNKDLLPFLFFVLSLVGLTLVVGIFLGHHNVGPANTVLSVQHLYEDYMRREKLHARNDVKKDTRTPVLVSAGEADQFQSDSAIIYTSGLNLFVIDRSGRKFHQWSIEGKEIWKEAAHLKKYRNEGHIHGFHLFKNGDAIFNVSYGGFPFGMGLVKVDKDSNIKWVVNENTHHDVVVDKQGFVYAPYHTLIRPDETSCPFIKFKRQFVYEDGILITDSKGNVVKKISLLDAVCQSSYKALLAPSGHDMLFGERGEFLNLIDQSEYGGAIDPLHLNAVRVVTAEQAAKLPMAEVGDFLVSFRNINTLAIVGKETGEISWAITGLFIRQHDPEITEDGLIAVLDNRGGGDKEIEDSRVLLLDPVKHQIAGEIKAGKGGQFFSYQAGDFQKLDNGNYLIAETDSKRIFELTSEGNILWNNIVEKPVYNVTERKCNDLEFLHSVCN